MNITQKEFQKHHPRIMRYSNETRRIMTAFHNGGWDNVESEMLDILYEENMRGKVTACAALKNDR